jgi:adenylate cyclase
LKERLLQLWENVRGPWKKRLIRSLIVVTTAFCIGQFGSWLIESSRWLGVLDENRPNYPMPNFPQDSAAFSSIVRIPSIISSEALARWSFDIPQMLRGPRPPEDVCIVYINDASARQLGQSGTFDRRLHAELLRKLQSAGARAVFFDLDFSGKEADSPSDLEFRDAMVKFGDVFLGATIEEQGDRRANSKSFNIPKRVFRDAKIPWGLLVFRPIDSDFGIRANYAGDDRFPTLSWRMAEKLGAPLPKESSERMKLRWLNYYGKTGTFESYSYADVLSEKSVSGGSLDSLKGKLIFVGGASSVAMSADDKRDSFRIPYTGLPGGQFAPGVDIHATATLNLLRGDWITRLPNTVEKTSVFLLGFFLTLLLMPRAPWLVLLSCILIAISIFVLAAVGVWHWRIWGNWLVPALITTSLVALANYLFEGRRRSAIIGAFGKYLSPEMAKQISTQDVDLKPGGKVVEGTIMFTDLEGFTSLSEELDDPARLSHILATYFTQCTGHVLELKGTIAKFIGDAVLAVWGAPLPDKEHVRNAVMSAWRLHKDSDIKIDGQPLLVRGKKVRTRIGIHTGQVLAGNLGSEQRFDWTVIGDPVNLAARLESLNKHLGTSVLISDAAFQKMGPGFTTRRLGAFIMKGKAAALVIHEMLGEEGVDPVPVWLPDFNAGVAAFERGDTAKARETFAKVIEMRGGADGPSRFYLDELDRRVVEANAVWDPEVELHEK